MNIETILDFVAKRIYELRIEKTNLSARKLSIILGFSNSYITQIENNKKVPSLEALILICNYFDTNLSDFFAPLYENNFDDNKIDTLLSNIQNISKELNQNYVEQQQKQIELQQRQLELIRNFFENNKK